jgi:hypothetical protein
MKCCASMHATPEQCLCEFTSSCDVIQKCDVVIIKTTPPQRCNEGDYINSAMLHGNIN